MPVRLFIVLASLILSLCLVEVALRLLPSNAGSLSYSDRPKFFYASSHAQLLTDFPEQFPEAASPKIAIVGDSFTFATAMQFDDTFSKKLQRLLQASGLPKAHTLNYGVPGYSTSHEKKAVVAAVQDGAEVLILQVTLNDPQVKHYVPTGLVGGNEFGPLQTKGFDAWLAGRYTTYRFLRERIHNSKTHQRYVQYYHDLFYTKRSWNSFKQSIGAIARYCDENGVMLRVVVFPLFGLPLDGNYPFHKVHKRIGNLLKRKEVPFLDLFSTYEGLPIDQLQVEPAVDFHPNEIGHGLAAEALFDWLSNDSQFSMRYTGH